MKIREIELIEFGKLKNRKFTLADGLTVVRGDNESGKSTLLAFIKFALYGVGRKNPNVAVGERERAISWSSGIAAGSLTVEDGEGALYRIERVGRESARGTYADRVRVISLPDGAEVLADKVPGEHFLGISDKAYDSICNIRQLETVILNGEAVKSTIENLLSGGEESTNVSSAAKKLDAERRRLLHANGKGGAIFESELSLERLKSEYRGAIVMENELSKNRDELARVELALAKARDEFEVAQRMCDTHDDAIRLEKFNTLRELREKEELLRKEARELDNGADFATRSASYDTLARVRTAREALERSEASEQLVRAELEAAEAALAEVTSSRCEEYSALLDEYGSPTAAEAFAVAKLAKKSNSSFLAAAFGACGAILLAFAAVLAFTMNNTSGALTVAFIGLILSGIGIFFYRGYSQARAELESFADSFGEMPTASSAKSIAETLENYIENNSFRTQKANALESAKFRLGVAEDTLRSERSRAAQLLLSLSVSSPIGGESAALESVAEKMQIYLDERARLDGEISKNEALLASISDELARFRESDLRERITPEIEEKIKNTSFERLKAERDLALHRTNNLGQYKAGIERNLASGTKSRPSAEIFPEIEAEADHLEALRIRLDAIKLATEALAAASLERGRDVTPKIRARANHNISAITDGKYSELLIDSDMKISFLAEGGTHHVDSLSRGSLDSAYFSVRLALLQTVLGGRSAPLYMDESLSQLDDTRAENTLRAIAEHARNSQCLLLTCQHRDLALAHKVARDTDVPVHVIEM